jgi:hypothetical protein
LPLPESTHPTTGWFGVWSGAHRYTTTPLAKTRCWRNDGENQCLREVVSPLGLCMEHLREMRDWG